MAYRQKELKAKQDAGEDVENPNILGVCLSSRRNMCIHPVVSRYDNPNKVDAMCRNLTASFVLDSKEQAHAEEKTADIEVCDFYSGYRRNVSDALSGVYSLADMKDLGKQKGWCPYFMARRLINFANVVVYNYQYMLDPKISSLVSKEIEKESIVVFDEAHNIDNICIEALSVQLDKRTIQASSRNLQQLQTALEKMQATDAERLNAEYQSLVAGLAQSGTLAEDALAGPPHSPHRHPARGRARKHSESEALHHVLANYRGVFQVVAQRQKRDEPATATVRAELADSNTHARSESAEICVRQTRELAQDAADQGPRPIYPNPKDR